VPTVFQVDAAFLPRNNNAAMMNDRQVKPSTLMKLTHQADKNSINATIVLPAPQCWIYARAVNLGSAFGIRHEY